MEDFFKTEVQKNNKSQAYLLGKRADDMNNNYLKYKNSDDVVEIFIAGMYAKLFVDYKYLSTFYEMATTRPTDQMPDGNLKSVYAKIAGIHFTLQANHEVMFKKTGELMHEAKINQNYSLGLGAETTSNDLL